MKIEITVFNVYSSVYLYTCNFAAKCTSTEAKKDIATVIYSKYTHVLSLGGVFIHAIRKPRLFAIKKNNINKVEVVPS